MRTEITIILQQIGAVFFPGSFSAEIAIFVLPFSNTFVIDNLEDSRTAFEIPESIEATDGAAI